MCSRVFDAGRDSGRGEVFQQVLRRHDAVREDVFRDPLGITALVPGDVFPRIRCTHGCGDIRIKKRTHWMMSPVCSKRFEARDSDQSESTETGY